MAKWLWATDLHLDLARTKAIRTFIDSVVAKRPECLLIAGDIAESGSVEKSLVFLAQETQLPIYFVLGNHDFYGSSLAKRLSKKYLQLHDLTLEGVIALSPKTALIGHDGWADALAGDYMASPIELRDQYEIEDFQALSKAERYRLLVQLGKQAAEEVERKLREALKTFDQVILVTHVPPFNEGALYENLPANADYAPHFVCKQMGEKILQTMQSHPEKALLVLSGHSHHEADYAPLPNVRCLTGYADYGDPSLQPEVQGWN